ncbi:MAG: amidohydrolase family protein [Verrucomicrobia bacterium]|nr:amidohydrolase family protein [Verrucomicrobiota bacterium]
MPAIDTHQHLWDPSRFSYSWMSGEPLLNVPFMLEEYRKAAHGLDILGSVYVDTDVDGEDLAGETGMIFSLAENPENRILGIVAGAKLERENAFAHLDKFWNHPILKGIRRVLHTQSDEIFLSRQFLSNLARLSQYGLSFDLCVQSRQLPLALELVKQFPETSFILDHCGTPDIRQQALHPWKQHIQAMAAEANVVCKISGIVAYTGSDRWSVGDLQPFVDHAIDCFGWNRVLWGSDWPVCTLGCPLLRWMELTLALTQSATAQQRESLFLRNAERVYRLHLPALSSSTESSNFRGN